MMLRESGREEGGREREGGQVKGIEVTRICYLLGTNP